MEKQQQSIIVGSLLGDGWLTPLTKRRATSRYFVKYNDKSLGYLSWLRDQLSELQPSALIAKPEYSQHYFRCKGSRDLGRLREIFYPNEGRKIIPGHINELLSDPLALAIWYQDDGTLDRRSKYHYNASFATYCFSYEENVLLAEILMKNFGVKATVNKSSMRGKVYYQLHIWSRSMEQFIDIVRPHIHEDFKYKILAKFS